MIPLTAIAGYGLNMMGFVGHEGMHGSLLTNRTASAVLGLFSASAVATYFEMGFAMSHWNHHRFTNQEDDPDVAPVAHLKTWWQRLLISRWIYNWLYFRHTLGMAQGRPIPFKFRMAYSFEQQVWFARLNFVFSAIWLAFYATIAVWNGQLALFGILAPLTATLFIASIQIYLDHAGLGDGVFENARSRTSWGMTVLFFGANYHLEHHAYPGVPCYRLPRLHRYLRETGVYDRVSTAHDSRFFGVFRSVSLPYATSAVSEDFDPFVPAVRDRNSTSKELKKSSSRTAA